MTEEHIKIRHREFVLTLEKTDLTDEDWVDIILENTKTGHCTGISKSNDDIYFSLISLIDTDWVYDGEVEE